MKFYILDVFAEEKLAGNQLAVIRGDLSKEQMLKYAQEMNYSETAFITNETPVDGGYDTRIFSPTMEFEFAGHPTLGTAFIVREEIIGEPVDEVILNENVGQIPVTFGEDGVLWMRQRPPKFGSKFKRKDIAKVLDLLPDEIEDTFPIQEVSTGTAFIIVPLKTLKSVKRAKVRLKRFKKLLDKKDTILGADAIFVFCSETVHPENDIHARAFVHFHGIPEDPATGAANGNFAAWLAKYRYFGDSNVDARVEQGYEIDRPSLLLLKAHYDEGEIQVNVGGRVQLIGKGDLID
ncbi:MAG: PhzF family phenazine biosynthesis protein [Phototrophicaceae bacterium]